MTALIAQSDWSRTPLGEPSQWPAALKTILEMALANRFPMVFWWGRDLIQFYNDAFMPILGAKHPQSLGQSARECWAEVWPVVGPLIERAYEGGPSVLDEDMMLAMNRNGFTEETYFTFSYSALADPAAPSGIGGVLATVQETTRKVVSERRLRLLRDLASIAGAGKSAQEECRLAAQTLERYAQSVPFAILYLLDEQSNAVRRAAAVGLLNDDSAAPLSIDLAADDAPWPVRLARETAQMQVVTWPEPPRRAVVVPIDSGVLIAGVNPRVEFDEQYRDFFRILGAQIGTAIARANALKGIRADETLESIPFVFLSARGGRPDDGTTSEAIFHSFAGREFRALAETIPVIVWTANASGWVDWYNRRWYEFTGQTPEEAAGWGWQAAHHPDDLPRVMEAWPKAIATGEPFEMEFRLRQTDGTFHMMLTRAVPVCDEYGRVLRWYGSNVDIQAQKEVLDRTRRIAETLQGVFLPTRLPHTPQVRIDAVYNAAEEDALVGGDWFDAVELPDGRLLLSIGDVTGHGLDASVIAARLRHAMVDFALENVDAATVLDCANRVIRFQHPDTFATAIVAFIDRDCSTFTYASAGHPPPLLARKRNEPAIELPTGGLPLGVAEDLGLKTHTLPITRDAVIALYTDGITEYARDLASAEGKLRAAVCAIVGDVHVARPAETVRDAVLDGAPTSDDAALLVVQFSQVQPEPVPDDGAAREKTWRFHSSDPYSAHFSRRELMRFLRRFTKDRNGLSIAELIVGEILANTVEHAPGLVDVRIDWTGVKPVLTVRDSGPGFERVSSELPHSALAEKGRGLFVIKSLAQDVSVDALPGKGTEVRVVLPLARDRS